MSKTLYRVIRAHDGDRFYAEGETREATAGDVKHLVPNVLEEIGPAPTPPAEKAETPLPNKAEPPVANKAEPKVIKTPNKARKA